MADPPRGSFQLSGKSPIRCRGTRGCTLALVCTRPCPVYLAEGHNAIAIRKGKSGGFKECLRASLPASCLILSSPYSFGVSFYPARSLSFFSLLCRSCCAFSLSSPATQSGFRYSFALGIPGRTIFLQFREHALMY